jgi:hypothetical protein
LHRHVAAIRDRDEEKPSVPPSVDAEPAECDVAHNASRHDHPDADPEPHLHVDATTAQGACRQEEHDLMLARFRAYGRL